MHRHLKKNGITAHKFKIEVHITKVELKLPQKCRISVIFKRGDFRQETVGAQLLEKGVAEFNEKFSVSSIFYYDETKNSFIPKEATMALNLITSKAQKLVGVTKFDLSTYLNNNIKDTTVALKIDKCSDKTAKFHFDLKMTQMSEIDPCTSYKDDQENISQILNETTKPVHSRTDLEERDLSGQRIVVVDNLESEDDWSPSHQTEITDFFNEKTELESSHLALSQIELDRSIDEKMSRKEKSKNILDESREQKSPYRPRNKTPNKENIQDKESEAQNNNLKLNKWLADDRKVDPAPIKKETIPNKPFLAHFEEATHNRPNFEGDANNKHTYKKEAIKQKLDEKVQTEIDLLEMNQMNQILSLYKQSQQKLAEYEAQMDTSQQIIKELKSQLEQNSTEFFTLNKQHEDLKKEHQELALNYENLQKEIVSNTKNEKRADFDLNIYKEKVVTLQKELNDLKMLKGSVSATSETFDNLELNDTDETRTRKQSSNGGKFEPLNFDDHKNIIAKLRYELKESKKRLYECENTHYKEIEKNKIIISELTIGINKLRNELDQKDKQIQNLETYIGDIQDEIQFMKLQEVASQIESLDLEHQSPEKPNSKFKIENEPPKEVEQTVQRLMSENNHLKKELDQVKKILSLNRIDNDDRKSIDSNDHVSERNDIEDNFEARINQLEHEKARIKSDLKKAKMGWASSDIERYTFMNNLKAVEEKLKSKEKRVDSLELEVFTLKSRLAELINVIMEHGGADLLDKIESIVTNPQ